MSRPGPADVGAFLRHDAPELVRRWRVARNADRPNVFPGLLDDLVEPFLESLGTGLETGGRPEDAFQQVHGVLRWPPAIAPAELDAEWSVLREVLHTACEAVGCDSPTAAWVSQALDAASAGTRAIDGGLGPVPPRVILVLVLSPVARVDRPDR